MSISCFSADYFCCCFVDHIHLHCLFPWKTHFLSLVVGDVTAERLVPESQWQVCDKGAFAAWQIAVRLMEREPLCYFKNYIAQVEDADWYHHNYIKSEGRLKHAFICWNMTPGSSRKGPAELSIRVWGTMAPRFGSVLCLLQAQSMRKTCWGSGAVQGSCRLVFGPPGKAKPSRKKRCFKTFLEILKERRAFLSGVNFYSFQKVSMVGLGAKGFPLKYCCSLRAATVLCWEQAR